MTNADKISQIQSYQGKKVNCTNIFKYLCQTDFPTPNVTRWKYDLEESDLMQFFSRTWTKENDAESFKAFLYFEEYICTPPYGEEEIISKIFVAKINITDLGKTRAKYTEFSNEKDSSYWHTLYGDNDWRITNTPIKWENVPENILSEVYDELSKALEFAIIEEE